MKNQKWLLALSFTIVVSTVACGKDNPKPQTPAVSQSTTTTPAEVVVIPPATTANGKITGMVHYDGVLPNLTKINMAADPKCAVNSPGDVLPETVVVGENQMLANVLIKITSGLEGQTFPTPTDAKVIDQKGCLYYPHVIGVQKGQTLKFLNSDNTLHNVHIQSKMNGEKNEAMPAFRKETTEVFHEVEAAFPVKCDVHPWMKAYIEVLSHPYFAVTKPDGLFEIPNLPAGHYQLTAWHERLGEQVFELDVPENGAVEQHITFKKPEGAAQLNGVMLTNWQ